MRIIVEIWVLGIALAVIPHWSKWYLPISVQLTKYLTSGELTLSILWLIHFSIRFPWFKVNREVAREFLR